MEAPSSFLPPLKRLNEYNAPHIHRILTRLVAIYLPTVRGTAPVDEDIEPIQSDDFERPFAIRWLTGFIARGEEWSELYTDGDEDISSGAPAKTSDSSIGRFQTEFLDDTHLARTTAFDRAAALLGACAGTSASGTISRELKFATSSTPSTGGSVCSGDVPYPSSPPITISLQDESISTGDHTAVGLQTWGSACILAERVARDPLAFGLPAASPGADPLSESGGARVLELGAGTGLLSILAGKLVERAEAATGNDHSNYTIISTDYHPAVLANLRANVQGNFPDSNAERGSLVDVRPLDWSLYLTGKPTTDLSRAPSTAPTPAIGTPISGDGQKCIQPKISSMPSDTQATLTSESPPIQTPSFSVASSVSTPTTSHSPQTPQTPRTVRSPPPNLARAVFSRLIARGLKFEMPGGPPGVDQNSELAKKSDSNPGLPNTDVDFSAHNFDSVPGAPSFDPHAPSPDSDIPKTEVDQTIEAKKFSPTQVSSPLLPLDASRSELLCANLQDKTSVSGIDSAGANLAPCLDEIDTFRRLDNGNALYNTGEDQRSEVVCLEDDSSAEYSAVGTEAPLFSGSERADGLPQDLLLGQQAPLMASPPTVSTFSLGELRTPDTIDYDPKIDITVKSELKIPQGSKDDDDPFNSMSDDNTSEKRMTNLRASDTSIASPFDQPFDVIFGADIVYELSHATLVRGVVEHLLRKPSYRPDSPPAYFYLIMPLRPTHADEVNSVDMAFPRAEDVISKEVGEGETLAIVKTETYARSAGVGRADEVQYVHYCIGWV